MKTIYYYQTFVGLDDILTHIQDIDVIIVSSIHFGKNSDKIPGIYLNDNVPDDIIFNKLWLQTEKASAEGCKIMLMMGGAGGAYQELFSDFDIYYPLLVKTINDRPWITGIDLDIGSLMRSKLNFTSSAVTGVPSDHIAPSLIFACQV